MINSGSVRCVSPGAAQAPTLSYLTGRTLEMCTACLQCHLGRWHVPCSWVQVPCESFVPIEVFPSIIKAHLLLLNSYCSGAFQETGRVCWRWKQGGKPPEKQHSINILFRQTQGTMKARFYADCLPRIQLTLQSCRRAEKTHRYCKMLCDCNRRWYFHVQTCPHGSKNKWQSYCVSEELSGRQWWPRRT